MSKKPLIFRLTTNDKIFLAKNLALLLKSGISLRESIDVLKSSTNSNSLKFILEDIEKDIEKGKYFSRSLKEKYLKQFGKFFISLIEVGELTGNLVPNLEKIAIELKKMQRLKSKIISIMIYPSFIIFTMIGIVILVVYFLFPRLLPVFESLNVELPLMTRIFLNSAKILIDYGLYIFSLFFILIFVILFSFRFRKFKYYFDYFLLKLPLISNVLKKYSLAQFSRSFAILLESGIPIVEALKLTGESLSNLVYQDKIIKLSESVAKGLNLEETLILTPWLFPYNFSKIVGIGERTGALTETLMYLTENYEEEVDSGLEKFVSTLEPIILIIIAVLVGFIALSILIPIYQLSDKLTK